jgi:hypothetical protein
LTLGLPGGLPLADGLHRLVVCPAITDTAGNPLDGDGNGTGGDSFLRIFRVDQFNLLQNGHFDACPATLAPWITSAVPPNTLMPGTPEADDAFGSAHSASAEETHSTVSTTSLGQCVPATGSLDYDLRARVRIDGVPSAQGMFDAVCNFYASANCSGASLGGDSISALLQPSGGTWIQQNLLIPAPAGTGSALCSFSVAGVSAPTSTFQFYFDALHFGTEDTGGIFADGFESGNTSGWSAAVP